MGLYWSLTFVTHAVERKVECILELFLKVRFFFYRNILLNYATYNPEVGYNQGMSDLLASVLAIVQDELDAFWCFVGLMEDSVFVTSPKDDVMDRQLVSLCTGS